MFSRFMNWWDRVRGPLYTEPTEQEALVEPPQVSQTDLHNLTYHMTKTGGQFIIACTTVSAQSKIATHLQETFPHWRIRRMFGGGYGVIDNLLAIKNNDIDVLVCGVPTILSGLRVEKNGLHMVTVGVRSDATIRELQGRLRGNGTICKLERTL